MKVISDGKTLKGVVQDPTVPLKTHTRKDHPRKNRWGNLLTMVHGKPSEDCGVPAELSGNVYGL